MLGVTLLAFALRVRGMGDSFFGDEGFTYDDVVNRSLGESLSRVREYEDTPPFFFVAAWTAAKVGDPLIWLRMPSLVFGTALIPLTYLLGIHLVSRRAALLGAGLLALSPFAVHFATEARAYSLLLFFLVASTLALVRALEEPGQWIWWAAFWLATVLALYTHYTAFFVVVGQAAWALAFHRREWRRVLAAYALVLAAVAPWMITRPDSHAAAFAQLYPFSVWSEMEYWAQSLVGSPQIGIADEPGAVGWWLLAAAGVVSLLGLASRVRGGWRMPQASIALLAVTALAAPAGLIVYSLFSTSVIAGRNTFASAPFMFLLVGAALDQAGRVRMAAATALAVAALVVGLVIAAKPQWERPAWKDAAHFIEDHASPGEPVVLGSQFGTPGSGDRDLFLQSVSIYADQTNLIGLAVQDQHGFRSLEPSRRVWVAVQSLIGGQRPTPPVPGPGFSLVSQRYFDGFAPIGVFRYTRSAGPWTGSRLVGDEGREVLLSPEQPDRPLTSGAGFVEGVTADQNHLYVSGWAADEVTGRPPRLLLLFHGGRFLGAARPSIDRPDVAKQFHRGQRSGFRVEIFTGRAGRLAVPARLGVVAISGTRAWRLPQLKSLVVQR